MRQFSVSVIISSYNYGHFLGVTIESVLAQTHPAKEIIIIDDGSTDNSAEVAASFGERVKFVEQENQGVCAARNNGAKLATGDILAFLDSDDLWRPEKLEKQAAAFERDEEVGLVSCGIRFFNSQNETIVEYAEGMSGWRARDILLYKEPVLNTTASAIAVRRDVFEATRGFDENRELFSAEDREFCYRAALVSKLVFIPEILVDYRLHGSNGHLNIPRMERALEAAYKKIFSKADAETLKIKRTCYGNLYTNLAGSHFRAGNYGLFFKDMLKSLWLTPANFKQFAGFPLRLFKRGSSSAQNSLQSLF
jgi:glycosyltransferase involved in cell wall biosynthesis